MGFAVLLTIIIIVIGIFLFRMYAKGKKVLSIFPDIDTVTVLYRDQAASGYADKTLATKLGGASGVIDVVVTDEELWLKCSTLFAGLEGRADMIRKVPLRNVKIVNMKQEGKKIDLSLKLESGDRKKVTLTLGNKEKFIDAVKQRQSG
jgi:hypothetical protein